MAHYEVIAGTVGTVYRGSDREEAERVFKKYSEKARQETARDPARHRLSPVRVRKIRRSRDRSDRDWHVVDIRTGCICPVGSRRAAETRAHQANRTAGEERHIIQQSGCTTGRAPEERPIVFEAGDPARRRRSRRGRDPAKARKYYVVDQAQNGLWQQVGRFTMREDAERFRGSLGGRTRVVHTYPSFSAPADRDPRRRARRSSRDPQRYAREWLWEMSDMLKGAGYERPEENANKLFDEGMGPEELRSRLHGRFNLEHTHGLKRKVKKA